MNIHFSYFTLWYAWVQLLYLKLLNLVLCFIYTNQHAFLIAVIYQLSPITQVISISQKFNTMHPWKSFARNKSKIQMCLPSISTVVTALLLRFQEQKKRQGDSCSLLPSSWSHKDLITFRSVQNWTEVAPLHILPVGHVCKDTETGCTDDLGGREQRRQRLIMFKWPCITHICCT